LNPPTPHLLLQNALVMTSFATLGFEFRLLFSAPPKEAGSFLSSSSTTIAPPPRQQWCRGGGRRRSECRLWQCLERSLQPYRKVGYQEGLRAAQAKNSNARASEEEAGEEESGKNECEKRVFMFGMGYTCIALANTLQKQNWYVCKMLTERISKQSAHQQCCCCCDGDDDSLLCSSSRTHFFLDLLQASEFRICGCACGRLEQMVNLNAAGFLAYTDDQSGVLLQQYACIAQIIICLHYVHILLCMHGGFEFSHVETVQDSFRDWSQ
jgi:hypothetical protein